MLVSEENELLTRVGSNTPLGQMFRRYWIPALLSEEIPEADCPPVRVRLLGENLVAFRDSGGKVGLLDEYCSHRRASLFYGRNEECGLRCVYHGWKYDVEGRVLETPAEPPGSTLMSKVHHKAYPCKEIAGVVFTYMGPPDKVPLFPNYPWFMVPPDHVGVAKFFLECNYLQALEGDCDTSHTAFLHRGNRSGGVKTPQEDPCPRFEIESTWCGLRSAAIRHVKSNQVNVRVSTFAMPFIGNVARGKEIDGKLDGFLAVYQVPCDDYCTWRYNFRFKRSEPMSEEDLKDDRFQIGDNYVLVANKDNNYLMDRRKQKVVNYTGIEGFATQDACITESMGPICDRSQEHLGYSDTYVIAVRRYLLHAVLDYQKGMEPPGLVWDQSKNDFSCTNCTSFRIPSEESWKAAEQIIYGRFPSEPIEPLKT